MLPINYFLRKNGIECSKNIYKFTIFPRRSTLSKKMRTNRNTIRDVTDDIGI